jgi:hypothetical protein
VCKRSRGGSRGGFRLCGLLGRAAKKTKSGQRE